nr:DUF1700 domain-containing protein [Ornithinibacillus caprae]
MDNLNATLGKLPVEERNDILQDFEEHFTFGLEEGKTEAQIVESLGSPNHIAKELVATYHVDQVEGSITAGNILRAVWAVIGLGFFNLVIVLGPFIALVAIVVSGWAVAVSFIASPLLVLVNMTIALDHFVLFDLFFSLLLAGLGLLIAIGMFYVTKVLMNAFVRYLTYNVNLVKGGMKNA